MAPVLLAALLVQAVAAATAAREEVIGEVGSHVVARGESLIELARAHGLGFEELAAANPELDAFVPAPGATAVLPTAWILPAAFAPGRLVVNLSEQRLYLLPVGTRAPVTFPIGVAREPGATPLGVLRVIQKSIEPTWFPTPSLRAEDRTLPAVVPPGPDNPLGSHALRLSDPTILIHGTNRPFGVGRKVTHGCIRLYPEDIPRLYGLVEVGTPVVIVREPVKVGVRGGRVLVEIHRDDAAPLDALDEAVRLLATRGLLDRVELEPLAAAAAARSGIPVDVTAAP